MLILLPAFNPRTDPYLFNPDANESQISDTCN